MMNPATSIPKHTSVAILTRQCRLQLCAILLLSFISMCVQAAPYSDLLIIVDEDGQGYTAQLTLFASEEMIVTRIPADRESLNTVFSGTRSDVYRRAHEKSPDKLTVIRGSVISRFRHRFKSTDNTSIEDQNSILAPVTRATLDEFSTTMADDDALVYRVSWVLPANIELLDQGTQSEMDGSPDGVWSKDDNSLVIYEQFGGSPTALWLEYRVHKDTIQQQTCLSTVGPSEWCSPDIDGDNVPDYRDLCISASADQTDVDGQNTRNDSVLADERQSAFVGDTKSVAANIDSLGCDNDALVVLSQIQFDSGQSYLNAQARASLDKVAVALNRIPERLYRIVSHTDNAGNRINNQRLSDTRASSVRHYLMLRGVGPNQLQARGFGESQPAHDNGTAQGRRNNRRIELQLIN